jgi:hypothetical protein
MGSNEKVKKTVKIGSMDWRQISTMQAYRNWSYDMRNGGIFMGIM